MTSIVDRERMISQEPLVDNQNPKSTPYGFRKVLSDSVNKKRASLTHFEVGFLQRLLMEGSENDIQSALAKLSDERLFFSHEQHQQQQYDVEVEQKDDSNDLNNAFLNTTTTTTNNNNNNNISIDTSAPSCQTSSTARVSNENIETVMDNNGIIDLQAYVKGGVGLKDTLSMQTQMQTQLHPETDDDDLMTAKLSQSLPNTTNTLTRSQSLVSSLNNNTNHHHRSNQILLRKASDLHRNLWRAHKSGLAITPVASNRNALLRTKLFRRTSSSTLNNNNSPALKSVPYTKNLSFLSASEHKLVDQIKLEDDQGDYDEDDDVNNTNANANANRQTSLQINDNDKGNDISNVHGVFRQDSSPTRRYQRRKSSKKYLKSSSRSAFPMKANRNLSITSKTNSSCSGHHSNAFPPPLRKAHRLPSDSSMSLSGNNNNTFNLPMSPKGKAVRSTSSNSVSSFPSIHLANNICNEDSLSSVTTTNKYSYPKLDSRIFVPPITLANPIRRDSSLSSSDYNAPSSQPNLTCVDTNKLSCTKRATHISPEIADKWLNTDSTFSIPNDDTKDVSNKSSKMIQETKADRTKAFARSRGSFSVDVKKKVMLRQASVGSYNGIGIEAAEINKGSIVEEMLKLDPLDKARTYKSFLRSSSYFGSFDESMLVEKRKSLFDEDTQSIYHSLSADNMSLYFNDKEQAVSIIDEEIDSIREIRCIGEETSKSWDIESEDEKEPRSPDAWNVLMDEYSEGYGYLYLPFLILGTSVDDVDSHPHVLSPPLMESLQSFLPMVISEQNFWMRYSLLRDGASLDTLLKNIRGATYTILALETTGGEVFGAFTSSPWSKQVGFFGNGEAFLWKMRQSRAILTNSIIDQAKLESEIDVYLWNGNNYCVQQCTSNTISIGGGSNVQTIQIDDDNESSQNETNKDDNIFGLGLAIDKALLYGTSSSCATFDNPPLSTEHNDGSPFEILNLEVWSITPEMTEEGAIDLECVKLFLQSNLSD